MEIKDCQGNFVSPGGSLLEADPVATSAKQISGRDEVTIPGSLKFKPRAVPDESFQGTEIIKTIIRFS